MSQYPPYDGQHNYAPPWPIHFAQNSNHPNHPGSAFFPMNNISLGSANFAGMPFNSPAHFQLPGLGMAMNGSPLGYQPQQFSNDQNAIFAPVDNQKSFDAPVSSIHPIEREPAAHPQKADSVAITPLSSESLHEAIDEPDREEGELSEGCSDGSPQQQVRPELLSKTNASAGSEGSLSTNMNSSQTQVASPTYHSKSHKGLNTGNKLSFDKIPPPPAASGEQPCQLNEGIQVETRTDENSTNYSQFLGKTPTQIRVMAQGALLSLIPHNIRFGELVKEDIDPTVLKQLYDDIGVKVATPAIKDSGNPASGIPIPKSNESTHTLDKNTISSTESKKPSVPSPAPMSILGPKGYSGPDKQKPLERKDVIARMLAEKAKKKQDSVKELSNKSITPLTSSTPVPAASNVEKAGSVPKTQTPVQTKEKNKALSELARQRMEELKKKGLKRQQSNGENANVPPTAAPSSNTDAKLEPATVLHHPLPERPAVSSGLSQSSTPQIPDVISSSERKDTSSPSIVDNRSAGTSTPFRNSFGKRPRASDFDELLPEKKPRPRTDRLVIDISEDEEEDSQEDDVEMSDASERALTVAPSKSMAPLSRDSFPGNTSSPSLNPQKGPNEVASLRQKDLEIQAMRRKIAELEEKNAKKLQRTLQSATEAGNQTPPLVPAISSIEKAGVDSTHIQASQLEKSKTQGLSRSPSAQSMVSMDIPTLDAELNKLAAQLAEFKREEEKLLKKLAQSREERRQLGEELESLGVETEGLSLEELRAAKETIERGTVPETGAVSHKAVLSESASAKAANAAASVSERFPSESRDADVVAKSEQSNLESSDTSMDESAGSAVSVSMDPESEPEEDQEVPKQPLEVADVSDGQERLARTNASVEASEASEADSSLAFDAEADQSPPADLNSAEDGIKDSKESSAASDIYEPPEPEDLDEAYSPKLSPQDAEEAGAEADTSWTFLNPSDAEAMLTRKPQDAVIIASKGDALDNAPIKGKTVSKFSPYQSPMKYFRAYRYHPDFVKDVKDGYRSLTYSHAIEPLRTLCPYEAAGGVCHDTTCEYQHWRDIILPDDKILIDMGNQREGKTPEEREGYIEGLKELINTLRREQVKDFPTVASEIAAYRRRFLSDPSRVLSL